MKVLSFLFWRILLPFVLALLLTLAGLMATGGGAGVFGGYGPGSPLHDARMSYFLLCLLAVFIIVMFVNELRITLKWGKEAEEFETELKEADEMEEERRRRASWIER